MEDVLHFYPGLTIEDIRWEVSPLEGGITYIYLKEKRGEKEREGDMGMAVLGGGEVQGKDNLATSIMKALAKNREEAHHCRDLVHTLSNILLGTEMEPPKEPNKESENVAEGDPGLMRVIANSTRITMGTIREAVMILEKIVVEL